MSSIIDFTGPALSLDAVHAKINEILSKRERAEEVASHNRKRLFALGVAVLLSVCGTFSPGTSTSLLVFGSVVALTCAALFIFLAAKHDDARIKCLDVLDRADALDQEGEGRIYYPFETFASMASAIDTDHILAISELRLDPHFGSLSGYVLSVMAQRDLTSFEYTQMIRAYQRVKDKEVALANKVHSERAAQAFIAELRGTFDNNY